MFVARTCECGAPGRLYMGCQFSECDNCVDRRKEAAHIAAMKGVATRRSRKPWIARPPGVDPIWQRKAMSYVQDAKRLGLLPILDGTIACTDCGQPATIYEHRDYSRPLDVEPVCGSCNTERGTAVWPTVDRYNFKKVV